MAPAGRGPAPRLAIVLGALGVIAAVDGAIALLDPPLLVVGLLDWPAHLATTLLLALALPRRLLPEALLLGAFLASLAIDLDHLPLLLGSDLLTGDLVRPYTHALWTLLLTVAVALALRRGRPGAGVVATGVALGLASHFARDLATGPGLNLLWPVVDAVVRVPWLVYLGVLLGLAAAAGRRASELSYGDRRRLEIARALASNPRGLLLDEPAAGTNPTEKQDLIRLIRRIRDTGIAVLLIEHDMALVMGLSDRVIVMDHGRVIAEGAPDEVQADPQVIEAYLGTDEDLFALETEAVH